MKFSKNTETPEYINVDLSDEPVLMVPGRNLDSLKKNILDALDKRIDDVFYENNLLINNIQPGLPETDSDEV